MIYTFCIDTIALSFFHLKTCADTVVSQFAKISHETNFIYCYDIMRRNNNNQQGKEAEKKGGTQSKGLSVPSSTSSPSYSPSSGTSSLPMVDGRPEQPPRSTGSSSHEQVVNKALFQSKIDLFFPFDPFKLPISSAYIQTIYRSWDHGDDDEDDDEEEDNTDGEDEDGEGNREE
jgi:RNA polymerase I-specific transcription initiation factor RRN3